MGSPRKIKNMSACDALEVKSAPYYPWFCADALESNWPPGWEPQEWSVLSKKDRLLSGSKSFVDLLGVEK